MRAALLLATALLLVSGAAAAPCKAKNCLNCNAQGLCKADGCAPGYFDMDGYCFRTWPSVAKAGTFKLDIPSRVQYLIGDGYCAEQALQMAAMYYGIWIPQQWARTTAGASVIPGKNMEQLMARCRVDFENFSGQGEGFQDFVQFAKAWVKGGYPVLSVAYIVGEKDKDFDHVQPIIGVQTASKQPYDYNPNDQFFVNTEVGYSTIKVKVGGYSGTRACKKDIDIGGCIPSNVYNGFAIVGPTYAGIGPSVRLSQAEPEEPFRPSDGAPAAPKMWSWTIHVSGLTKGQQYIVYKITDVNKVPPTAAGKLPADAAVVATFTATGPKYTVQGHRSSSGTPAWYIAVAANSPARPPVRRG